MDAVDLVKHCMQIGARGLFEFIVVWQIPAIPSASLVRLAFDGRIQQVTVVAK